MIRIGVVGRVQGGAHDGKYIFIYPEAPLSDGYSVYCATDTTFAHLPPERECYRKWLPNDQWLPDHIRQNFPAIAWDEGLPPPRLSAQQPHAIRFGIVGRIQGGVYDSWYIFIRPRGAPDDPETSYTVYLCTDVTFRFAPEIRGYSDYWLPNYDSLSHDLQRHYPEIVWDEQIEPPQFGRDPRLTEIAQRLRERFKRTQTEETDDQGRL